jgi:PHD/YefM family antitoxin component YafN of YafNO toxin-antitoxin module
MPACRGRGSQRCAACKRTIRAKASSFVRRGRFRGTLGHMLSAVIVPSKDVRLPRQARDAVSKHRPVEVRNHDKPTYYVLHADDYALVEGLLERHHRGLPVPVGELLTDDDFAVLAEEREFDGGLDRGILSSWEH